MARLAAQLLQQAQALDTHPAINRLAHIVDGEQSHAGSGQCFHLHPGTADGFGRHRALDRIRSIIDREFDSHPRQRNRVTQWNQLAGAFRCLDRCDPRNPQHISLAGIARTDHRQRCRQHHNAATGNSTAHRFTLGTHINHVSLALRIKVSKFLFAHISCYKSRPCRVDAGQYHSRMNTIPLLARLLSVALVATLSIQSVAAALPDLGDAASGSLSPAMEKQIGQEALSAFRFQDPTYIDDPEVESYLQSLGARLSASGQTGERNFSFFALKDPTINAFAMPGGVIGVHSGLIVTSQSESELAAVIAHEMAHVSQHHIGRSMSQQGGATALMIASLLIAVLAARNSPMAAEAAIATGQAAVLQSQLNYSRDFEREADRIGLQILEGGGFDPQGMPLFFERMQQAYRTDGDAPAYLRTHPLTTERISDVQGRVRNLPYRQVPDSIEYALTKAKLAVLQETPRETIERLRKQEGGRVQDRAARLYALTLAYIAERNYTEARRSYAALNGLKLKTPMLAPLGAQLELAQGHGADAAKLCRDARNSYPGWRTLGYCIAEGQLAAGDGDGALATANELVRNQPNDYRVYNLQAKVYTALNKPALAHRALSQVYQLHGMLRSAIEQMRLAQRSRGANDHEEAAIDARLRELRAKMCDELGGKQIQDNREDGRPANRRDPDRCDKLAP